MKRNVVMAGGAIVMVALIASTGFARDGGPRGAGFFERFDLDGNGEITKAEFEGAREARFTQADQDGDGQLTAEELIAAAEARNSQEAMAERAARMIDRFDDNDDGTLSLEELPEPRRGAQMFDRVDANGDGVITQAEAEEMRGRRGGKDRKDRDG